MKIVLFSDVHGNLEALQAVVAHAAGEDVGMFVCLGDIVGYGADPEECVNTVRGLPGGVCVRGNHDAAVSNESERTFFHEVALEGIRFTVANLSEDNQRYLSSLPFTYREHPVFMAVHASPWHPESWEYVLDRPGADRAFEALGPHRVAFIGHSHSPVIFSDDANAERFVPSDPVMLDLRSRRYLINVGSVGQPRDGNPDASYAIFDDQTGAVRLYRVCYDRELAAEKILKAGLPPVLAERLLVGY